MMTSSGTTHDGRCHFSVRIRNAGRLNSSLSYHREVLHEWPFQILSKPSVPRLGQTCFRFLRFRCWPTTAKGSCCSCRTKVLGCGEHRAEFSIRMSCRLMRRYARPGRSRSVRRAHPHHWGICRRTFCRCVLEWRSACLCHDGLWCAPHQRDPSSKS